jgi:hypothetical protein
MRSLDRKLANIKAGRYTPDDFIIADAKDGDIGFGRASPVPDPNDPSRFTPRATHLQNIRDMTQSGLVDIMLMSASTAERLSNEGLFKGSDVTPAIRLNDTTDIWSARGGRYREEPSRHHRTARVDQARDIVDLGLYSVTFSNQRDIDAENAEAYSAFRAEAAAHKMRHFLEVFNPAFDIRLSGKADMGAFINDNIVRTLAGVDGSGLPEVPEAAVQRAARDGGAGLLRPGPSDRRHPRRSSRYCPRYVRVAEPGRALRRPRRPLRPQDSPRRVAARHRPPDARSRGPERDPREAVKAYHGALQNKKIRATRELSDDIQLTEEPLKLAA